MVSLSDSSRHHKKRIIFPSRLVEPVGFFCVQNFFKKFKSQRRINRYFFTSKDTPTKGDVVEMIELIKEHSWWISIVLTIIVGIYPTQTKTCLTKIVLFVIKPNTIIIALLLTIVTILITQHY